MFRQCLVEIERFELATPIGGQTLLSLLRLDLQAKPPGAAVTGFTLSAHPDRPRQGQLTLFGPEEISPDRLATALAKLFALLGEGRLGAPRTVDGHRPERLALVPFAPPPPPLVRRDPRGGRGLLAVRVLRPPVPLEVIVSDTFRPVSVRPLPGAGDNGDGRPGPKPPEIRGAVRVASGPWGVEEAWWTGEPMLREYWDVELSGGTLARLFRDPKSGDWFADGVYD